MQRNATEDVTTFALYMGQALTKLRGRESVVEKKEEKPPWANAHQQGRREHIHRKPQIGLAYDLPQEMPD